MIEKKIFLYKGEAFFPSFIGIATYSVLKIDILTIINIVLFDIKAKITEKNTYLSQNVISFVCEIIVKTFSSSIL